MDRDEPAPEAPWRETIYRRECYAAFPELEDDDMKEPERVDDVRWRIPRDGRMQVDGLVFASTAMMDEIRQDKSLEQVANVAHLPGILGASLAMPDIHWGYGFPIGGVAGMDVEEGVVSPGGVGYDIN